MHETTKVSFEIMDGLDSQNKLAAGSRNKVRGIFANLNVSDSIIGRMLQREMLTKLALAGIVGVVICAILFILYKKFFN